MRCESPSREEHNLVVEAWEAVQFAHQLISGDELEEEIEEIDGEAQAFAESLVATRLARARHSRCRRTCCEVAPLVAPWDKLAVEESACAGLTGGSVGVGSTVVGNDFAEDVAVAG